MTDSAAGRKREKVAVLGGGVAGLTAALELSATPDLRERYEVTVYQLGWRCGGKCATGRDPDTYRIQEHGLHLWFGGYDNAFKLLATCYKELDRPADHPLATMDQAWHPLSSVVLYDYYKGQWSENPTRFAIAPGNPWEDDLIPRFWAMGFIVLQWMLPSVRRRQERQLQSQLKRRGRPMSLSSRLARRAGDAIERKLRDLMYAAVEWHQQHIDVARKRSHPLAWVTQHTRDCIWRWHASKRIDDKDVRHRFSHLDVLTTSLIGILRDEVIWTGFDSINHLDFREWLTKHGLQRTSLESPDVRVVYDESFAGATGPCALDDGPPSEGYKPEPAFAAGAALYGLLRTQIPYRGSVMWQAEAGMGDTVIAPMYETLVRRGVKVEFFRKVMNLGVDAQRGTVNSIEIVEQATPLDDYCPLIAVDGLLCWPAAPRWQQLRDGQHLKDSGFDFERGDTQDNAPTRKLIEGEHFDRVVLAIAAGALAPICSEVMANDPAFANMLRHTNTVMTQAFQMWLTTKPQALGFEHGHSATSTFIEPLDTGCDNSQVLDFERWPIDERPASVWYFCGILPDRAGDDPTVATARAQKGALAYLDAIGEQWSEAVKGGEFSWELLVAPDGVDGAARFDAQYWRANSAPTERYVQTLPGTIEHRLSAGKSGLSNLVLAGDWTRNGFNIGAVEAAVMSGMQASRAISGSPEKIAWEAGMWMAH